MHCSQSVAFPQPPTALRLHPPRPPQVRKNGTCGWLRPDGKTQVTVEYKKDGGAMVPLRVHTILISTQHNPDVSNEKIKEDLMEHVIKPVVREAAWTRVMFWLLQAGCRVK